MAVLDEAQAIKNPDARQTRAAKTLKARARIALTGTPVENRLGDLWSIFDFVNPGLLGSAKQFTAFAKRLATRPHTFVRSAARTRAPVHPAAAEDRQDVIADLPEKTEMKAYCSLSRKQAALYEQSVKELAETIADTSTESSARVWCCPFSCALSRSATIRHSGWATGRGKRAKAASGRGCGTLPKSWRPGRRRCSSSLSFAR